MSLPHPLSPFFIEDPSKLRQRNHWKVRDEIHYLYMIQFPLLKKKLENTYGKNVTQKSISNLYTVKPQKI